MKIAFVCPIASKFNPDMMIEPLSVGYLVSYLKSKGYKDFELYFGAFTPEEEIAEKSSKADIVGFTTASSMVTQGIRIADMIKKINPNVITVIGGAHATALPEKTLRECPPIDIVVRGEAEHTFHELIQAIENGKDFSDIRGVTYRKNEKIVTNPARELIEDIDEIPYPDREFIQQRMFVKKNLKIGKKIAWMMATRGCPFICNFCTSKVVWKISYRKRSPKNIVGEIKELVDNYGVNHINFADDTMTIDKQWTFDLCKEIRRANLGITWSCNSQTSVVTRDMLYAMRKAGCEQIWFGVESGNKKIRWAMEKFITTESIINAFEWAHEAGLKTRAYMIIGGPGESYDTIKESEELMEKIKPTAISWTINTMLPGLKGYDEAVKKGLIEEDKIDWSGVGFRNIHSAVLPTEHLSKEDILSEWERVSEKFKNYQFYDFHFRYMPEYLLYRFMTTNVKQYPLMTKKLLSHIKKIDIRKSLSKDATSYA
ncbi:radical SAM protein [Candidatus Woesearchaeota archaeon]|nr:radical SAM protein [Candidatus Woesearchaeota archaeon]